MNLRFLRATGLVVMLIGAVAPAGAQTPPQDDPDMDVNFAQPDFTLVALPTTLRLPRHKSAFRVTHRFSRSLGAGDFGSLLEDFFGLDSGAQIGLEYRYGLFSGTQVGFHRTSDRTIAFFGQHEVKAQSGSFPFTIDALASIDGTNNFRDRYSPTVGAAISRTIAEHAAFYVEPMWVNNSIPNRRTWLTTTTPCFWVSGRAYGFAPRCIWLSKGRRASPATVREQRRSASAWKSARVGTSSS